MARGLTAVMLGERTIEHARAVGNLLGHDAAMHVERREQREAGVMMLEVVQAKDVFAEGRASSSDPKRAGNPDGT